MLHHEMGLESSTYDYEVFRITNEITKQVFPVSLDIDHPFCPRVPVSISNCITPPPEKQPPMQLKSDFISPRNNPNAGSKSGPATIVTLKSPPEILIQSTLATTASSTTRSSTI
jgi:hypothetical protein